MNDLLRSWTSAIATVSLTALVACGGSEPAGPITPGALTPAAISAVSSPSLTGTAGVAVPTPPTVKVTASSGAAIAGVTVTFAVRSGGGSLIGNTVSTDAGGVAAVGSWTLGTVAGPNTMTATVIGLPSVTFTAAGMSGSPSALTRVAGDSQSASVGTAVGAAPSARVVDANGNPVAGVSVVFAVMSGGGSVSGPTQVTNVSGVATSGGWILGSTAGANTLAASSPGLAAVMFSATGTLPPTAAPIVSPAIGATAPNATVAFTAQDGAGMAQAVTWSINNVAGGTVEAGFISANGLYTAPATIPTGDSVVVTAASASDPTKQRSAKLFFIPDLTTKDYYVAIPRVVDAAQQTRTRFLLVPPATATSVTYLPFAGAPVPLTPIGGGVLTFELEAAAATLGYVNGTLHDPIGQLDYRSAAGAQIKLTNLSMNVRDGTMPNVVVTALAADAQRSPHVLNIRLDAVTIYPDAPIVAQALQLLGGDQFDFVAVVATVTTNSNRGYIGVRNDVTGIGAATFNTSAPWGGTGRLRGVIAFPIDGFFDGAEQGMIHEIGHAWINYATDAVFGVGAPHWRPSTMAGGAMGFNIPGSNQGGNFPWSLTSLGDGTVRINAITASDRFIPLDLYLMGLLPPDSVPPMYVLPVTANPNAFTDGMISPATTYTIADYITRQGPRLPSSATAPRQFTTAVVVLSYGRLLTPSEMAFFDHASARAETTVPLPAVAGRWSVIASGFFLATGGRATLRTRLP
ncbi:MAG: hypothetical protein ABIR59_01125 [Gemmatimonadales bacterium]